MSTDYDVVVVGGRVAGASTAMLLARAGARVALLDRSSYGSDTVSTHGLMRAGVLQLSRWGLLDEVAAAGTPPIRQTLFHYADGGSDQVTIRASAGVDALYAPRRLVLDRILVDAAAAAGADVAHQTTVTALLRDDDGRVTRRPRPGSLGEDLRAPGRDHGGRRRHPVDRRRPGGRSLPAARPRRQRGPLPLLRRHPGDGLRVGVGGRRRRRLHPHQRRADLRLRGYHPGSAASPAPRRGGASLRHAPRRDGSAPGRPGPLGDAGRPAARLGGCPGLRPPALGAGLGAGRGRRLLQGPDHHARHHRRPARRRAADRRDPGGARRWAHRSDGAGGLPGHPGPTLEQPVRRHRGGRVVRLGPRPGAHAPARGQLGDERRGRPPAVAAGPDVPVAALPPSSQPPEPAA